MFNLVRQTEHPFHSATDITLSPQSTAHPSHKTSTDQRKRVGLGNDQLACKAFQRKMHHARETPMSIHVCPPTSSCFLSSSNSPKFQHPVRSHQAQAHISHGRYPFKSMGENVHPHHIPAARQVPSQNPQIPATSDQVPWSH